MRSWVDQGGGYDNKFFRQIFNDYGTFNVATINFYSEMYDANLIKYEINVNIVVK